MLNRPFASTRATQFIQKRIKELKPFKTQADIAREAGFIQANMLAMIKSGATKMPLERVPGLARALECDAAHLFAMTLEQHGSSLAAILEDIYGTHVTANEVEWLKAIRTASDHCDPTLTSRARKAINSVFGR